METDELVEDPRLDVLGNSIRSGLFGEISVEAISMWFIIRFGYSRSGKAWPGIDKLATITGKSKTSIKRYLRELISSGFLVSEARFTDHGRQTSNMYTIALPLGGVQIWTTGGPDMDTRPDMTPSGRPDMTPSGGPDMTPKQGNKEQGNKEQGKNPYSPQFDLYVKSPEKPAPKKSRKTWKNMDYPEDFESWWTLYPRKMAKREALRAWISAGKRGLPEADEISRLTQLWALSPDWSDDNGKYVPRADRWLDRDGWLEEPRKAKRPAGAPKDMDKYDAWKSKLNSMGVKVQT